jgi:hypothetical protein
MTPANEKIFCIMPWISSHVGSNGMRKLCCAAEDFEDHGAASAEKITDYWNSKRVKEVRRLFLNNQIPSECVNCIKTSTQMNDFNTEFKQLIGPAIENTLPDGTSSLKPIYLDYRLSNVCNLACRMCNSYSSSTIKKLEHSAGILDLEVIDQSRRKYLLNEAKDLIRNGQVQYIYFADGEPFLSNSHWEIINVCIELKVASKISLVYSSNLSSTSYKGRSIFDYLKEFKNIQLLASLDGVDGTVEFLRSGLSFDQWKISFNQWLQFTGKENISFNIVLTTPTILNLYELLEFVLNTKCSYILSKTTESSNEIIFSPRSLTRRTLTPLIKRELERIRTGLGHIPQFELFCKDLLENKLFLEEDDRILKLQQLSDSFNYHCNIDAFRADSYSTIDWFINNPELHSWTTEILHEIMPSAENLADFTRGQTFIYQEKGFNFLRKFINNFDTLIFDFRKFPDKLNTDFLNEIIHDFASPKHRLVIVSRSAGIFNRLLNLKNKDRSFTGKVTSGSQTNMKLLTDYFRKKTILKTEKIPLPLTSDILINMKLKRSIVANIIDLLGRIFPSFFHIHQVWVIELNNLEQK